MSVAFRRESDEEHKEPRFELPIPPGPNLVTERGLKLLEDKVAELETAVAAEQEEATLETLRRELRYFHTRLATAQLAPRPGEDVIGIGSRATVRMNGAERTIEIVGGDEADPAADRVAFYAPLGRALMGASEGDRADFNGVPEAIEILRIGTME